MSPGASGRSFKPGGGGFEAVAAADEHFALLADELDHLAVLDGVILPDLGAVGINVRLDIPRLRILWG